MLTRDGQVQETLSGSHWCNTGASLSNWLPVPYLYLCTALSAVLLLCFIVPAMEPADENRHFLRACQIAQGGWLPEIDKPTGRAGGMLPAAVFDFVRDAFTTEYLRLHTIRERMEVFERASRLEPPLTQKKFVPFPTAAIYPPALYLPQATGIRIARLFSDKVYLWFYCARVFNAVCAVFLVFLALRIAPQRQFLLMLPAVLPMSLYQMGSISSDASIIAVAILFVALCIRFLTADSTLIRFGLVLCLFILVLGKPVHLALGLLLLAAYRRLGWRRAILFCGIAMSLAGSFYILWLYLVKPFMLLAGEGHGRPAAQIQFIMAHPVSFMKVVVVTLKDDGRDIVQQLIGYFGWVELPLPPWFYKITAGLAALIISLIIVNRKKVDYPNALIGSLAAASLSAAVMIAGYVMWNKPASPQIEMIQGRYFIPILPIAALVAAPLLQFDGFSRMLLVVSSLSFLLLSEYSTIRIAYHYYFPHSAMAGQNINALFKEVPDQACPAWSESSKEGSFWHVESGRTDGLKTFRVLFVGDDGTILNESDPALIGAEFSYELLPRSSHSRRRISI